MFNVILAITKDNGIGYNGSIPWNSSTDLQLFKKLTMDSTIIMGRKTVETLPELPGRTILCLSKSDSFHSSNVKHTFRDFDSAINFAKQNYINIFIAGGAEIYNIVFNKYKNQIQNIYLSIMKDQTIKCDTFVNFSPIEWKILYKTDYPDFTHYKLCYSKDSGEFQYLNLLKDVYNNGFEKVGRNGITKSSFGKNITFNLIKDGFPLLTTKKMFFRGIVEELLFFIKGQTNSKILEEKGINIWKGNTCREFLDNIGKLERQEGILGPMYGYQWRHYNAKYDEIQAKNLEPGIDQLKNVINLIKNDPHSRRILLTDYNPLQSDQGVLYPCHSIIIQFYVEENFLDMLTMSRSCYLFHGCPFNIASYALLLVLISKVTNLKARNLHISFGDSHIYQEHYDVVHTQLSRIPYIFPDIYITKDLKTLEDIENLKFEDFIISDYNYYETLKAPMIK
jgi:dihydrofolate reductase/thymidylate synthase